MRKIFIVTERRADYSRFKPILSLIEQDHELTYDLVVTGLHSKEKHGLTVNEIKMDGFRIADTFDMFEDHDVDSGAAMVRAFGLAAKNVTYALERSKPDIILSGFDIGANLAVTIAGAHMNIPVMHIQGGEVTGTIDESIRHAMSKFAHYHFASNQDAVDRLIKLGEKPDCVFNVGCPSLDAIFSVLDDPTVVKKYGLTQPYLLVLQHPVTSEIDDALQQITETLQAVMETHLDALFILPNNDAGYSQIVKSIQNSHIKYVSTLKIEEYVNLLKRSCALVGNSSSGIHETASLHIPTVNIGTRQQGRMRASNVIDTGYNKAEIKAAIERCLHDKNFLTTVQECQNPYGDGTSAKKIVALLKSLNIDKSIIQKRITY